jgi:hypothetical protein
VGLNECDLGEPVGILDRLTVGSTDGTLVEENDVTGYVGILVGCLDGVSKGFSEITLDEGMNDGATDGELEKY